ncbi:MAG: sensor histidine kinase, partial [Vicinamibacterales bacterium]
WTGMLRVRRIDGHPIEVEASIHRTPAGPCLIALHDVSERVRAEDELRRSQERYRRLANRTRHVREEERARLSRDLHDRLGQALTGLKMDLAWLLALCERFEPSTARSTIAGMMDRIDTTIAVVRRISADLRPGVLDRLGLQAAIEWRAREFERQTGVRCRVGTAGEVPSLDERQSTELFRILEELLTNVSRHAKATRVRIVMKGHRGKFALQVYDNGRGIAPDAVEGEYSIGLIGMRERATLLGGTMTLGRGRRGGTMAVVRVPVHPRLVSQTAADGALE